MAVRIDYNPQNIRAMSDKEVRKAYSEVRSIARKRVERMRRSEFKDTDIANKTFKPVKDLSPAQLRRELLDVSVFVRDPRSLLNYHRNIVSKTLETLSSHGYTVAEKDLKAFGDFMEFVRDRWKGYKLPPSDIPAQIFEKATAKGISARTLMTEFKAFLRENDAIFDENALDTFGNAVDYAKVTAKYGRVTAKDLRKALRNEHALKTTFEGVF